MRLRSTASAHRARAWAKGGSPSAAGMRSHFAVAISAHHDLNHASGESRLTRKKNAKISPIFQSAANDAASRTR